METFQQNKWGNLTRKRWGQVVAFETGNWNSVRHQLWEERNSENAMLLKTENAAFFSKNPFLEPLTKSSDFCDGIEFPGRLVCMAWHEWAARKSRALFKREEGERSGGAGWKEMKGSQKDTVCIRTGTSRDQSQVLLPEPEARLRERWIAVADCARFLWPLLLFFYCNGSEVRDSCATTRQSKYCKCSPHAH